MCYTILEWNSAIKKSFLIQVSQYTFAMCSYREKKSEPQELMQLEGYTVDYTAPHTGTFHYFEAQYVCVNQLIQFACFDLAAKNSKANIPLGFSVVKNHAFRKKLIVRRMNNKLTLRLPETL